jgi:hypothetical protein
MAMRYRWSDGPNDFASPVPRPGATLQSPIVDETHIYIHDTPRRRQPTRAMVHDAPRQPAARPRGRDQAQPELLCRVGQHGETGEFSATGPNDEPLRVENGKGGLEIWRDPEPEDGQDAVFGATDPPGAANIDAVLRRRMAPRQGIGDLAQQEDQLQAMQSYLNRLYAPRS